MNENKTDEAKALRAYEALHNAYNEHDLTTKHWQRQMVELADSLEPNRKQKEAEEAFHLHNCITAVLRDILYAGEPLPPMDDYF
jgi:hypothetical protein